MNFRIFLHHGNNSRALASSAVWSILFVLLWSITLAAVEMEIPSKAHFCHAFTSCRKQARDDLAQCTGIGFLSALAAREGISMSEMADGRECILEMDKTLGNSLRALYERLEKKALKCATGQLSSLNPEKAMNYDEFLVCKAAHLDILSNFTSPFALFSRQDMEVMVSQKCIQIYDGHMLRCRGLKPCCLELDSCLDMIKQESKIRSKELRLLKLLDKCKNEIPIKSAEILLVNSSRAGAKGVGEDFGESNPVAIPILALPTSTSPSDKSSSILGQSSIEEINNFPRAAPAFSISPPDQGVRDLFDFIFPGLGIKRGRSSIEERQSSGPTIVDNLLIKQRKKINGGGLERMFVMDGEDVADGNNQPKSAAAMKNSELSQAFVIEPNKHQSNSGSSSASASFEHNDEKISSPTPIGKMLQATTMPLPFISSTPFSYPEIDFLINDSTRIATTKKILGATVGREQEVKMIVARIFCQLYAECLEVKAQLMANCSVTVENAAVGAEVHSLMAGKWAHIEQVTKCLETHTLKLVADIVAPEKPSNYCPFADDLELSCRKLRPCCPIIV